MAAASRHTANMKILATLFVALIAAEHFGILIMEMFFGITPSVGESLI